MADYEHGPRTTEEARDALQRLVDGAYGKGLDQRRACFTIPCDPRRDADCVLSDVIEERDRLRAALAALRGAAERHLAADPYRCDLERPARPPCGACGLCALRAALALSDPDAATRPDTTEGR